MLGGMKATLSAEPVTMSRRKRQQAARLKVRCFPATGGPEGVSGRSVPADREGGSLAAPAGGHRWRSVEQVHDGGDTRFNGALADVAESRHPDEGARLGRLPGSYPSRAGRRVTRVRLRLWPARPPGPGCCATIPRHLAQNGAATRVVVVEIHGRRAAACPPVSPIPSHFLGELARSGTPARRSVISGGGGSGLIGGAGTRLAHWSAPAMMAALATRWERSGTAGLARVGIQSRADNARARHWPAMLSGSPAQHGETHGYVLERQPNAHPAVGISGCQPAAEHGRLPRDKRGKAFAASPCAGLPVPTPGTIRLPDTYCRVLICFAAEATGRRASSITPKPIAIRSVTAAAVASTTVLSSMGALATRWSVEHTDSSSRSSASRALGGHHPGLAAPDPAWMSA